MPDYNQPADQWLGGQLARVKGTAAALSAQSTEYIVDSGGVCRAIVGHLIAEPNGTATGLEGWGVAVKFADGEWVKLPTEPHMEAFSEAGVARTADKPYVISATQDAFLLLEIHTGGSGEAELNLVVASSIVARYRRASVGANDTDTITVPVAAGEKWEAQVGTSGTASVTLYSSYRRQSRH
jgi:hypothetical protein